jgi:hypothetical protein
MERKFIKPATPGSLAVSTGALVIRSNIVLSPTYLVLLLFEVSEDEKLVPTWRKNDVALFAV